MSYVIESSLQTRTLVEISSLLWSQSDIRALITIYQVSFDTRDEWKKIEEKVIEKVEKLSQPAPLKEKISGYIRPMGWQILKWKMHHVLSIGARSIYLSVDVPTAFSWTPYGTIDRRKTAKKMIEDRFGDVDTRIKLAFIYCLEEDAQKLWDSVPEEVKGAPDERKNAQGIVNEQALVGFWTTVDEDMWEQELSAYGNAFRIAVQSDNQVAAEYFWRRLIPSEKEMCLEQASNDFPDVEVLYFLLSQMSEEQRKRVFRKNPLSYMRKCFDWPWLSYYVDIANLFWDSLSTRKNCTSPLIALVNSKINNGFNENIYRSLFKELWECVCRRFGADVCINKSLLHLLIDIKDRENLSLIFRAASPAAKREFMSNHIGLCIAIQLVEKKEFDLFEIFIQECLPSKLEIRYYERELKEFAASRTQIDFRDVMSTIDDFFSRVECRMQNTQEERAAKKE